MQIRINKDICQYHENLFFGLSLRQFSCAVGAVAVTAGLYYLLRQMGLGRETVSWLCILGGAPVAAAGFFSYNGLTFEQFLWAFFKSELLLAGRRVFKAQNFYWQWLTQSQQNSQRQGRPKQRKTQRKLPKSEARQAGQIGQKPRKEKRQGLFGMIRMNKNSMMNKKSKLNKKPKAKWRHEADA